MSSAGLAEPRVHAPIPDRVLCASFHRPHGAMVCDGVKTLEPRPRPWTKPPAWVGVFNKHRVDRFQPATVGLPGIVRYEVAEADQDAVFGPGGHLIGLMYVTGSRQLRWADIRESYFYEDGRFAWIIGDHVRFVRPLSMADAGLKVPPHGMVKVDGAILREAMEQAA